jgi:multiple sugar transport system substrate-binding protein
MPLSRRQFIHTSLGSAALLGLAACSDEGTGVGGPPAAGGSTGSTESAGAKASPSSTPTGTITFAFWGGSEGELKGFSHAKEKFEAANPGATVEFKVSPYDGFFSGIDRGFQAGNAPDVFRVDYTTIGKYSSEELLLDMTPYFTTAETEAFLPALWNAIKFNGVPYGVPHQTDTSCIIYDTAAFEAAGITSVPDSLDTAWTWEEFSDVATKLRASLPDTKFPFAYPWTQAGAFRWLSFLYQAGGTLLTDDLTRAAIPSEPATKALDFTKGFFEKSWVPPTAKIKTSQYSDSFFLSQTVPMAMVGDFLVPSIADPVNGYKGEWKATYLPRDQSAAADLGGNAIVARRDSANADLAAAWLRFLVSEDMMKYFCEQAIELPTLQSLATAELEYVYRPDVVTICAQQATTISDRIVAESTLPAFNSINTLLADQLELAFNGQSTEDTLTALGEGVDRALGS